MSSIRSLSRPAVLAGVLCLAGAAIYTPWARGGEQAVVVPPPAAEAATPGGAPQKLVIAGGCFWGVQAVFQHVKGVTNAVSGYAGGPATAANYTAVSSGRTGHAEAVEITFDPREITAGKLLQVFFSVAHNPTQLDNQGPDHGPQYRSSVFVGDAAQTRLVTDYLAQIAAAKVFTSPVVTKVEASQAFYPAESYHQDYLTRHPNQPYIVVHDRPKLESLKRLFPDLYRPEPKLVATGT